MAGAITFQTLTLTFVPNSSNNGVQSVTFNATSANLNLGGGITSSIGVVTGSYNPSSSQFSLTLNTVNISFSSFLNLSAASATLNYTGSSTTAATVDVLNAAKTSITTGTAHVSTLTVGITGGSLFAGVNGPASTSTNAQGLSLSSVTMALALLYDSSSSGDSYAGSTFYAFQLGGGTNLKAVGMPPGFTFSVSNITANLNGTIGTSSATPYWVNFDATFSGGGLAVGSLKVDYTTAVFQVGATLNFNFDGFVYINGTFTFQQGTLTNTLITTSGGPTGETAISFLEIGGSNISVFAGYNGPKGTPGAVGMELDNVSFAFALITAVNSGGGDDVYYGLTVTGPIPYQPTNGGTSTNNFSVVGLPSNFSVSATNLEVDVNGSYNTVKGANSYALDFGDTINYPNPELLEANPPANTPATLPGLLVTVDSTSGAAIPLNFTQALVQASGTILLNLDGFIYISGSLAFQAGTPTKNGLPISVVPTTGTSTATVSSVLEFGGNNVTIFAGEDGPSSNSGATGIQLSGASFALALVTDSNGKLYYGFAESGGTISAVGLPSDFTFNVSDIAVQLNGTSGSGASLNFDSTFGTGTGLTVPTGTGTSTTVDFATPLLAVQGTLDINIASYVDITGSFAFSYNSATSTLTIGLGTSAFTGASPFTLTIAFGGTTFLSATGGLDMAITTTSGLNAQNQTVNTTTTTINSATLTIATVAGNDGLEIPHILEVDTPTIGITNVIINNSTGQISGTNNGSPTLTITAASAKLFPDNSTITATVSPTTGNGADGLGFQGTFNLQTGAFDIQIEQFELIVGPKANPTLTADASTVSITYAPNAGSGQQLVSIGNATVTFNSFSGGSGGAFKGSVTNLVIFDNGFQFASLTLQYGTTASPATIDLGPLVLTNPSVTLTNFGATFGSGGSGFSETGSLTVSVDSASFAIGSVSAAVTNLSVTIDLDPATLGAVTATAGELDINISTFLTITATDIGINTSPASGAAYLTVGTATVTLNVAPSFTIGGSASDFSIINNGGPEFLAGPSFSITLNPPSPSNLGLPNWLGFSIQSLTIQWANNDFQTDPLNFIVTLSASITSVQGLPSGLNVSGSVTDLIINVGELGTWLLNPTAANFPISFGPLTSVSGGVSGTLFGMQVSANFVFGVLSFNAEGGVVANGAVTLVPPGAPSNASTDTTIAGSGFYVGISGSAVINGIGTVAVSLGFSNLGPLTFYLSYTASTPLILDPESGLAIAGFSGGVAFNESLQTPTTATDLPGVLSSALTAITGSPTGSASNIDITKWQQQLELATASQYLATSGGSNLSAEYSQPFLVLASVTLDDAYLTPNAVQITGQMVLGINPNAGPGQAPVTILVAGSVILGGSSNGLSGASGYLYASITNSSASLMFLVDEPGSAPLESFGGSLTFAFTQGGNVWVHGNSGSPDGFTLSLSGFFEYSALGFASVDIQGSVTLSMTPSQTTIDLSGDVNVSFLGDLGDATGQIVLLYAGSTYSDSTNTTTGFVNNSGNLEVYGALELSTGAAFNSLASYGLMANGAALFQVNTTGHNVLVELPPVPSAPSGTAPTPFVIESSVLFDMTITGTSSPYATISYEVGGNQLFQMQGFFDLRITDNNGAIGAQMFADINSMTLGPSGASFLSFSGFGLFVISSQGFAAEIDLTLGTGGSAIAGISFNASFQLVINTTSQAVTFNVPSVTVPTSTSGSTQTAGITVFDPNTGVSTGTVTSLVIPAGPPQGWLQDINGAGAFPTSGAAGPYIVVTGVGSLSLEGLQLNGFFYFQLSDSPSTGVIFALVLNVNGTIPGVGSASVEGALQISSAGEVALLAISGGNNGGSTNYGSGITLQLTAELALNTTSAPVSNIGGVPLTSPSGSPITIAAGTYEIIATGTLALNVGGVGFVITGVFSSSISTSSGVTTTTISLSGTLTATLSGSTLLTMNAAGVLVATAGGPNPGMAGELTLTLSGSDPLDGNGFSFNGSFSLIVNTTSAEQAVSFNGSTADISAGANGSTTGGAYVEIDASGSMIFGTVTNGFLLNNGNFFLSVGANGLAVSASATMVVEVGGSQLFSVSVGGAMLISSAGLAASLTVTSNLSDPNGEYAFSGTFTLEVNTTGVTQTIGTVVVPAGPGANATPGPYFQIYGNAMLALGTTNTTSSTGIFLNGTFYMLIGSSGLTVAASGTLTATVGGSTLLSMQANGALIIVSSGANPGMAGELTLTRSGNSPLDGSVSSFSGTFNLEVNTTGVQQTVPLGSSTITISAGPDGSTTPSAYIQVDANGTLTFGTAQNGFILVGDFFLAIGTSGFEASANVGFTAVVAGVTLLTMNATGVFVIAAGANPGIAAELNLTLMSANPLNGSGFSFNGSFTLIVNTTGAQQTVPLGNSSVTISAGPNNSTTGGAYFEIEASGGMVFGSSSTGFLLKNGSFYLTISAGGFAVSATATMAVVVGGTTLLSATASGAMLISSQGFAASISVTTSLGDPNSTYYAFNGTFTLQVNTTGAQQTIGLVTIPAGPGANGSPSGPYIQLYANATLELGTNDPNAASGIFLSGTFYMVISSNGLTVAANASLTAVVSGSTLLTMNATGVLVIATGQGVSHPGIAAELTLTLSAGNPLNGTGFSFNGSFSLIVNSTLVSQSVPLGSNTITISAGPANSNTLPGTAYVEVFASGAMVFGSTSTGFALTGSFYIQISTNGLAISTSVSFTAKIAGSTLLSLNASGALVITSAGLAASFTLTASAGGNPSFGMSNAFSFSGAFLFEINTTGVTQTVGSVTIPSGPGSGGAPGSYFEIAITGATQGSMATLSLGSGTGLQLSGSFYLTISSSGLAVSAAATLSVVLGGHQFFSLTANGALLINSNGIAASLTLGAGTSPTDSLFAFANVTFILEVNTTGQAITSINNLAVSLPASTAFFEIAASGQLKLGGVINLSGGFVFTINGASLQISVNAVLAIFGIDFTVNGFAQISSAGLVLALQISFGGNSNPTVTLIPGVLALSGQFILEVNTTGAAAPINIKLGNNSLPPIPASQAFLIQASVSFNVLGYSLGSTTLTIKLSNGVLSATGSLSFNFFNFITFNVSFYFDSNFNYWFDGSTYVQLGSGSFNIHGGLLLEFANQAVANNPSAFGSPTSQGTTFLIQISGGVTAFGWDFASISATISVNNNFVYFSVYVSVSFYFFSIGGTVTINLGSIAPLPAPPPPPPVGTVFSGPITVDGQTFGANTLLINLGTYAQALNLPALPSQTYTITIISKNSDGTYNVQVNSPQLYTGAAEYSNGDALNAPSGTVEYLEVSEIVVPDPDVGNGTTNVTLSINNSFTIPVVIFAGRGTNSFTTGAGTTNVHGSSGTDTVIGGSGNVTFNAGTGASAFTGGGSGSTVNTIIDPGPVAVTESGYTSYSLVGSTPTSATLTYGGNQDILSGSNITVTLTAPTSGATTFQVTNYSGPVTLNANGNGSVTTTVSVNTGKLSLTGNVVSESNGLTGVVTLQNNSSPYGTLTLRGTAAGVTITVNSWSGTGAVSLNGINDTYIVNLPGSGTFTSHVTDTGTTGALTINGTNANNNSYTVTSLQVTLASQTVTYSGLHSLTVNPGNGTDTITINSIVNATTINLGTANNTINVNNGNSLANITALLTINGGVKPGTNTLVVNDSADATPGVVYTLTATTLSSSGGGFGSGGSLAYSGIAIFTLSLARPGANQTGNTMNIRGMSGTVTVNLGNGINIVNLGSTGGSGTLGGGTSSLINLQGSLTLNGSSKDTMNVDDSGSSVGEDGILQAGSLSFSDPLNIVFNGFNAMTIYLSKGADIFAVVDTFASASVSPVIALFGVGGNDVFDLFNNHAPMSVTGGNGKSSIYVFANASALILSGGTGIGAFYIFASANGSTYVANAAITITGGSAGTANNPNTLSIFGTSLSDVFNLTGAMAFTNLGLNVTFSNIQGWTLTGLGGNNIFYIISVQIPTTIVGDGTVPVIAVPPGLPNGLPPVIPAGTPGLNLFYVGWQGATYIPGTLVNINAPLTLSEGNAGTATAYINDSSDIYGESYTMTPTTLVSTDMPGSIIYDSTVTTMDLILGSGENTVTVNGTGAGVQTIVNGGAGDDTFIVNGSPALLSSPIIFNGGTSGILGNTLTINGSGTGNNFVITSSTITGLGATIYYNQIQAVSVYANSGNNTFVVNSIGAPTSLFGGTGNDSFTVNGSVGPLTILGGTNNNRTDTFVINGNSGILTATGGAGINNFTVTGNSGTLTINGSGRTNTYIVNGNQGILTLNGSTSVDTFTVNAIGAPATIIGGTGVESITVNAPLAASLTVIGGTNSADTLTINGISGNDYFIITGTTVTGVGSPINYSQLGNLVVNGGAGNNTFQVNSDSTKTTLNGSSGNDIFYILTTNAPTFVNTNGGTNTIYIGSAVPSPASSVLLHIAGAVTVNGDGADTLNIDDSADSLTVTGTLTSSSFTGFGMGVGGITYSGISLLNVLLGRGQATLNIQGTNSLTQTFVNTNTGLDTVNIGSLEPRSGGITGAILGALTITGGGSDILNVDDTGDAFARTGTLTPTTLTGLNMGANGVVYSGFASVNISLGQGGDTFTVTNTPSAITRINGGAGNDTFNILATTTALYLNGEGGNNTFNLSSLAGMLTSITGAVNITGGTNLSRLFNFVSSGVNTVNINDTGDTTNATGTLTSSTLTGLGLGVGVTFMSVTVMNINLGSGNNTFNVRSTNSTTSTTLNMGTGVDAVNIGSLAPGTGGVTTAVQGALTIVGGGRTTLNVDDTADATSRMGTLTSTTLTGLGMGVSGITYSGVITLNISLGSGGNIFTIVNTSAVTTLNSGSGNDIVNLLADSNITALNGQGGNNIFNVQSINATTTINTGTGVGVVNVGSLKPISGGVLSGIQAALTVTGDGSDTMNVDNTGDLVVRAGNLTSTTLTGLGMGVSGITYSGLMVLNVSLGAGGNTFTIINTNSSTTTTVNTGSGSDTVNVQSISGITMINTRTGVSVINVGSLAPNSGGVVRYIQSVLIISGDGKVTVNVDDTGDTTARSATLTATSLTGMGMSALGIMYSGLGALNVYMGSGGNTLTVTGVTNTTVTTINGGTGINSATLSFSGDFGGNLTLINFATATLTVGGNFTGILNDAGAMTPVTITGSLSGTLNVGSIATMTIGGNLTGTLNVTGLLGTLTVNGGTPGQIIVGSVNIITVLAGFGNTVLNITAGGIQREILALPVGGGTLASTIHFAFVYDAQSAAIPQVAIRITNPAPSARSFNLELFVINNSTAQFNLSRVDSLNNANAGISNISVQGSLLTKLTTPELALFTNLTSSSPGGVVLPADSITGVELANTLPIGFINVAGIEGLAFAILTTANGTPVGVSNPLGSSSNIQVLWNLLGSTPTLNPASDTLIVPFEVTQSVMLYAHVDTNPDMALVMTLTQSLSGGLPLTATVQILPTSNNSINPLVQSVTFSGSGASVSSQYSVANIISTGSIGNITVSGSAGTTINNAPGLGNVTASNIFGNISVTSAGIYGVIQTTSGDIGQTNLTNGQISSVTSITSNGAITGQIISRGNLISTVSTSGNFSGVIAAQGNVGVIQLNTNGTPVLTGNALTRFGGITISGTDSGQIIALGNLFGNLSISGSMTGRIAVKGVAINGLASTRIGILGNVSIPTFALGSAIISGGLIGDSVGGTTANLGNAKGFIAAIGGVNLTGTTISANNEIQNAVGGNLSTINAVSTNNHQALLFDTGGNLAGLALIETDLTTIQDNNGVLSGTIA